MNAPTTKPTVYDMGPGFNLKVDAGDTPDIVGHLYTEFLASVAKDAKQPTKKERLFALRFVEFARKYLDENPPQSQRYVGYGIGLQLRNGVVVVFNTQDATQVPHRDAAVAVTSTKSQPGRHGISDTSVVPITTGQTKVPNVPRSQDQAQGQQPDSRPGRALRRKR